MKNLTIDRRDVTYFGELSNLITYQQEKLAPYIQQPFNKASFKEQIQLKKAFFTQEKRALLQRVLETQLQDFVGNEKIKKNLDLLKADNTFTVTAGHQLNLYGGPLYTIYKIMDAIRLAEELKKAYPSENFVPVFWMATEDHDFEEINHLHLFGDTLTWETAQQGAVGRFDLTGFSALKEKVLEKFQNNAEFSAFLNQFYEKGTLAENTRTFFMELVADYGLIIIDGDDPQLKASFAPLMEREITQPFAERKIAKTTESLEKDGFHGQAHARSINLFYCKDQRRERIIQVGEDKFEAGDLQFTKDEILTALKEDPISFSPNVVFRPLYQEYILPNLCYLGGGGEMAYWLQLKGMFEEAAVPYPLIKVRNSIQWIDQTTSKRIEKLNFEIKAIFSSIHELKKRYVLENTEDELDFLTMEEQQEGLTQTIEELVLSVDKNMQGYAKGEIVRLQKQLDNIKQKLIREQKKNHENAMNQIDGIYDKMFPSNGLQERYENIIPYLAKFGVDKYISTLHKCINPWEQDLILVLEAALK